MNKNPTVKILVTYHKPATLLKSEVFTPIQTGRDIEDSVALSMADKAWLHEHCLGDNTGENISGKDLTYCELCAMYWAWKNYDKLGNPDYIGLMHYRRQLCFDEQNTEQPDRFSLLCSDYLDEAYLQKYHLQDDAIRKTVSQYDVVLSNWADCRQLGTRSPYYHYGHADPKLNIAHLDYILQVLYKKHPEYKPAAEEYLHGPYAYFNNLFVAKKEWFFEYCAWLFPLLQEAEVLVDPMKQTLEELRVVGYLGEWLMGIYLTHQGKTHRWKVGELKKTFIVNTPVVEELKPRVPDEISIVMSCDDNYAMYLAVTVRSIIEQAVFGKYTVYVLGNHLSEKNKQKLLQMSTQQVYIKYVEVSSYLAQYPQDLFYTCAHFTLATYYRIFVPYLFKHFEKILYCDCDAVFMADPAKLYQTNIKGYLVAAVRDAEIAYEVCEGDSYYTDVLQLKKPLTYFQAGMMLCNIPEMRQARFTEKCMEVLAQLKTPRYPDQDIMNVVCAGKIKYLDPGWDFVNYLQHWRPNLASLLPCTIYLEWKRAELAPKYIHYAGGVKPWQDPNSLDAGVWWEYARHTPFYEQLILHLAALQTRLMNEYPQLKRTYTRCRIMANITWGKKRRHYLDKKARLKARLQMIRQLIK